MAAEGINVSLRLRPMNARETQDGQQALFLANSADNSVISSSDATRYHYDRVFDTETTNAQVYEHVAQEIVRGVTRGINGTIFAYGQTSSGKTHTMLGSPPAKGVLEMAAEDIFRLIASASDRDWILRVSFVEIYNEIIRDLLSDALDTVVEIRQDPRKGVYCEATEVSISDYESIIKCLRKGISKRAVEATAMNDTSSRSHTIFKLVVESRERDREGYEPDGAVLVASLNLVDLAGSESVRHTGATGQRAKEGGKINQSLLSLSRVIQALSVPGTHVSFRDSKLTRLLQPSLSGNAKMSIVCCITPAEKYLEETRGTLQFASRAKLVKTNATVNEVLDEAAALKRLRKELDELKEKQRGAGVSEDEYARIESEKAELVGRLAILQEEKNEQEKKLDRLREMITGGGVVGGGSGAGGIMSGGGGGGGGGAGAANEKRKKKHRDTWCPGASGALPSTFLSSISLASAVGGGGGGGEPDLDGSLGEGDVSSGSIRMHDAPTGSIEALALAAQLANKDKLILSLQQQLCEAKEALVIATTAVASSSSSTGTSVEKMDVQDDNGDDDDDESDEDVTIPLAEVVDVNEQLAKALESCAELTAARDELASQLDVEMRANVEAEKENERKLSEASNTITSLTAQMNSFSGEAETLVASLREQIQRLEASAQSSSEADGQTEQLVLSLEQDQAALRAELDRALEGVQASEERIAQLRNEYEASESKLLAQVQQNEKLEMQMVMMEEQQSDLVAEIETASKNSISTLETQIADLEEQNLTLQQQLASASTSTSDDLEGVQAELASLKEQMEVVVEEKKAVDTAFAAANEKVASLETEISHAEELFANMEQETVSLRSQLSESHEREERLDIAIQEADGEVSNLKQQITTLEEQLEGSLSDTNDARSLAAALHKTVASLKNENEQQILAATSQATLAAEERFTAIIEAKDKDFMALEAHSAELGQKNAVAEEETARLVSQMQQMQMQQMQMQQMQMQLQTQAVHVRSSESSTTVDIHLSQESLDAARREMERAVESMRSELGNKEADVSRLMALAKELEDRAVRAEQIVSSSLERENAVLDGDEASRKRISQLQTNVDLLKSERDVIAKKLSEVESELKSVIARASVEEERLMKQLQAQNTKLEKMTSDAGSSARLAESVKALEQRLTESREERDEARGVASRSATRVEELSALCEDLNAKLSGFAGTENGSLVDSLREDVSTLTSAKQEWISKCEQMERDLNETNQRMKKTKEEMTMIRGEWDRSDEQIKALAQEKATLTEQLEQAYQQIQELTDALNEAENATMHAPPQQLPPAPIAEPVVDLAVFQQLEADVETLSSELQDAAQKNADMDAQLQALQQESSSDREELRITQRELTMVEADLLKAKADLSEANASLEEAMLRAASAGTSSGENDQEKEMLMNEMNSLLEAKMEAEAKAGVAEAEARAVREQLAECDRTNAREQAAFVELAERQMDALRENLQTVESELALAKAETSSLRVDLESLQNKCLQLQREVTEKDDALAETENALFELRQGIQGESLSVGAAVQVAIQERDAALARLKEALHELSDIKEDVATKEKRIAHLETTKLTKDQLDKIKQVKEDKKKLGEDNKVMKKQLQQLKKAYDDLKTATSTAATSAAAGGGGGENAELSELRVRVNELSLQLENSQHIAQRSAEKLRECSQQLAEFETERSGVLSILERAGIDTTALRMADTSTASEDLSASIMEQDLADAVNRLALKLAEKEKRLETLKASAKDAREEIATLFAESEDLRNRIRELEEQLENAKKRASSSIDSASSEVQALEEENIELMKENRELRREAAVLKTQITKMGTASSSASSSSSFSSSSASSAAASSHSSVVSASSLLTAVVPAAAASAAGGVGGQENAGLAALNTGTSPSLKRALSSDTTKAAAEAISAASAVAAATAPSSASKIKKHKKAKALVSATAGGEGEAAGECSQQ